MNTEDDDDVICGQRVRMMPQYGYNSRNCRKNLRKGRNEGA
jgi:hypothetical protein